SVAAGDGTTHTWEAATGKLVHTIPDYKGGYHLAVSPDGRHLATTDYGIVRLWHTATGKPVHDFASPRGVSLFIQFAPDGRTLVSPSPGHQGAEESAASFWDATTGRLLKRVGWEPGTWAAGAVSGDGRVLASGRAGEKVTVRDVASKKVLL